MFIQPTSEIFDVKNPVVGDCVDKAVVLEPLPVANLPPEPVLSQEDLKMK